MKNWEEDDDSEYCTAKQDLADAEAVANHLSIPLHRANFAAEYWDNVFEHFLSEYQAGRTPNPTFCVTVKSNSKFSSITPNYSARTLLPLDITLEQNALAMARRC